MSFAGDNMRHKTVTKHRDAPFGQIMGQTETQHIVDDGGPLRSQELYADVIVPLLQNIFGSIGTGLLAWLLVTYVLGPLFGQASPESQFRIGAVVAGLTFGVACVLRFFSDELRIPRYWYDCGYEDGLAEAQAEIDELAAENSQLVQRLSLGGATRPKSISTNSNIERLNTIHADATELLEKYLAGEDTTRATWMEEHGGGKQAWMRAREHLVKAGVLQVEGHWSDLILRGADAYDALNMFTGRISELIQAGATPYFEGATYERQ